MQFTPLGALRAGSVREMTHEQIEDEAGRLAAALDRLEDLHDEMNARRVRLEAGLNRLAGLRQTIINQLDALTPDADLEPSLGAPEWKADAPGFIHRNQQVGGTDDREHDDCDDEPSLAASIPTSASDQRFWSSGVRDDDVEHDTSDLEPSLSASCPSDYTDQTHWLWGATDDREGGECEDEGAQCDDEGVSGLLDPDNEPSLASLDLLDQRRWSDHLDATRIWPIDGEDSCEDEGASAASGRSSPMVLKAAAKGGLHCNIGPLVPLTNTAAMNEAQRRVFDALVDEFDMLALGRPSPFVIAQRFKREGLLA